jgi:hypothetical protein
MRLTALSGSLFGAYFAFYQGCKYAAKVILNFLLVLLAQMDSV